VYIVSEASLTIAYASEQLRVMILENETTLLGVAVSYFPDDAKNNSKPTIEK
jgi:hypothetical protein